MNDKAVLDVVRIGLFGNTGDDRSPESLPFPACMASLMECLGEEYRIDLLEAHGRTYRQRLANVEFLNASGMAYALLWRPEYCMSSMDVMIAAGHSRAIARAFDWAGYAYAELVMGNSDGLTIRQAIVSSIDRGVPVLAFGLQGNEECCIVAGYDDRGDVLIGWSHFQSEPGEQEMNGMFRQHDWEKALWKAVIPGQKTQRTLTEADVISFGADMMRQTQVDGDLAGTAAYDAWIAAILGAENLGAPDMEALHEYHHNILFNLAELRCWGGKSLRDAGRQEPGECFQAIHDTCWQIDAVTREQKGAALMVKGNREQIAALLERMKQLDVRVRAALLA